MTRTLTMTAAVLGNFLGIAPIGYWCEWVFDVVKGDWARRRAVMSRIKMLVLTRPGGAQAPAPQRMSDRFPARVDHGEGLAPLLVAIPVLSLVLAGFLIMMLATLVEAPRLSSSPSSSDAAKEVRVGLSVLDEIEVGETMVRLGPDFVP